MEAEVVIVGAGSTGLFTALYLTELGLEDIILVERSYIGSGSSGRCAGGIRASFSSKEHIVLMSESIKLWRELTEKFPEIGFRQKGYLWLLTREEQIDTSKNLVAFQNTLGVPTRIVSREGIEDIVPSIDLSDIIAGIYDPIAGKVYPFDVLYSLAHILRENGVEILTHTNVEEIVVSNRRAVAVRTSRGRIKVKGHLIVAAGVWSRNLLRAIGIDLPMEAEVHHILVTEEVRQFLDPLIIHVDTGAYMVQDPIGGVLMGVNIEDSYEDKLRADFLRKVARIWLKYFPQLRKVNLLRYWIGYYEVTPDHHPVIGSVPEYDNILVATGFSGHGFMMGPIVGLELSRMIIGREPYFKETKKLTIDRFARGELIEEKAVIG